MTEETKRDVSCSLYKQIHSQTFLLNQCNYDMFLAIEKRLRELLIKNKKAFNQEPDKIHVTPELYQKYARKYSKLERPPSRNLFLTNI